MGAGRLRAITVLLFVGAAIASVVAQKTGHGVLTALSFTLFGLGVVAYFQWRRQVRARVFDREDKTS